MNLHTTLFAFLRETLIIDLLGILYSFQAAFAHFRDLDERINFVATKVVHLGDQLEGVNTPRERAAEAYRLMKFFSEFLEDLPLQSEMFNDPFRVSRPPLQ